MSDVLERARKRGHSKLVYDKAKRTIVTVDDKDARITALEAENARLRKVAGELSKRANDVLIDQARMQHLGPHTVATLAQAVADYAALAEPEGGTND